MAIPKVIHFLWLKDSKPQIITDCLASWKKNLEGYEIKEWNENNFPYQDFLWTREAFEQKKWAFVTDYFRLWVLYNYGGIYLDADIIINNNFDQFLDNNLFIGVEFMNQLGAHCMGAEKEHPFIKKCLEYYENRHFAVDGKNDMRPLPHILTEVFAKEYNYNKKMLINFDGTPLRFNDITVYNDSFFTINIKNGNNICEHLGMGCWRDDVSSKPDPMMTLQTYFVRKYYLYDLPQKPIFRRIYCMLRPAFLTIRKLRKRTRIKIVKRDNL